MMTRSAYDGQTLRRFSLGEAFGLRMVGPLEKPTRLDALEALLLQLKPTLAS